MRHWIRDEDGTPQGFPVGTLLSLLLKELPPPHKISILRSEGYGLTVNEWDNQLDSVDRLPVEPDQLLALSSGTDEWFYNLDVTVESPLGQVAFGLHDSTAMYLEGPQELTERVCGHFEHVSVAGT
jgi:hypothetical protein